MPHDDHENVRSKAEGSLRAFRRAKLSEEPLGNAAGDQTLVKPIAIHESTWKMYAMRDAQANHRHSFEARRGRL